MRLAAEIVSQIFCRVFSIFWTNGYCYDKYLVHVILGCVYMHWCMLYVLILISKSGVLDWYMKCYCTIVNWSSLWVTHKCMECLCKWTTCWHSSLLLGTCSKKPMNSCRPSQGATLGKEGGALPLPGSLPLRHSTMPPHPARGKAKLCKRQAPSSSPSSC